MTDRKSLLKISAKWSIVAYTIYLDKKHEKILIA